MTEKEKKLGYELYVGISLERFRKDFRPHLEESQLIREVLEEALQSQDAEEAELALVIGGKIGFTDRHLPLLIDLLGQEWHCCHENLVQYIEPYQSPRATEVFFWVAQVRLACFDCNNSAALARKAIYALAKISGPKAREKLEILTQNSHEDRRNWAIKRLNTRDESGLV